MQAGFFHLMPHQWIWVCPKPQLKDCPDSQKLPEYVPQMLGIFFQAPEVGMQLRCPQNPSRDQITLAFNKREVSILWDLALAGIRSAQITPDNQPLAVVRV